jgi:5-methylcytosine-specific restriction protein B
VQAFFDLYAFERNWEIRAARRTEFDDFLVPLRNAVFPAVTTATVNELLRERRFVVLQGPPGTGKTRMAEAVRREFFKDRGRTVQFHPAITYEDFVVGLSPDPTKEGLRFEARRGWLLDAAADAGDDPFVLIIDEINRGDLGKVLGEAIYLFEPREVGANGREVHLTHRIDGQGTFRLPENLYVLGTMNTADRSIAGLDLAVRRRFAFVTLTPDREAVVGQAPAMAVEFFDGWQTSSSSTHQMKCLICCLATRTTSLGTRTSSRSGCGTTCYHSSMSTFDRASSARWPRSSIRCATKSTITRTVYER